MKLAPRIFNAHLRHMGQDVSWRRAAACPCRDPHTGAARMGCRSCAGRGWFWDAGTRTRIALTGMRVAKEWEKFGQFESGDVVVSIGSDSAAYGAGEKDRLTFLQSSEPFQHQAEHTGSEKLPFLPAAIERVLWLGAAPAVFGTGTLGGILLGEGVGDEVVEGSIASVATDGTIAWRQEPPVGAQYTVIGRRQTEYFLFRDLPQDRAHHGGLALPRRVALRRFDLFGR